MLTTTNNKIGKYNETIYSFTNEANSFKVGVLDGYGAAINRIEIPIKNKTFNLIKGYNNIEDFDKAYKGVLLAPFPNRIKNGQYNFNGETYQLPINRPKENNALHGFLYNKSFKIIENTISKNTATLKLANEYKGGVGGYPFKFKTLVTYVWNAPFELKTSIEIENIGDFNMPIGLGWHPYFQLPQSINNIALKMDVAKRFSVDEQMIPTLKNEAFETFNQSQRINEATFDDCFELNTTNPTHKTTLIDDENNIELSIEQEVNTFRYLQVYTPPTRNCIAIEPMTCIPNAYNNKVGLQHLKPKELYKCNHTIHLKLGKA